MWVCCSFSAGSTGPTTVPSPPRRDPTTSLSVGRARAKSMVAALADLGKNSDKKCVFGLGNISFENFGSESI